MATNAPNLICY